MRRRSRRPALNAHINITPLVDVMLVLLIVFMICAPMMRSGVDISLPKTRSKSMQAPPESVTVSMDKTGSIFLDSTPLSERVLVQKLKLMHKKNPSVSCLVCADASLNYQRILSLLTVINTAGIQSVSLVSENKR